CHSLSLCLPLALCSHFSYQYSLHHQSLHSFPTRRSSDLILKDLCQKADVPLQFYANRSDELGGSTLGNIAMSQVSMNSVDIGLPDRKSTRLNSSHVSISYAVFCLKKKSL